MKTIKLSNKVYVFSLLVIFIAMLFSCRKKKSPNYLSHDLREFYGYDKGSYWIFYDSLSNSTDSIYVTQNTTYMATTKVSDKGDPDEDEIGNIWIYDINYSQKFPKLRCNITLSAESQSASMLIESNTVEFISNMTLTWGMPVQEQRKAFTDTTIYECRLHKTFENYTDVYEIYNGFEQSHDIIFLNKEQGFVKIINNNRYLKRRMHLLRHHIVRKAI